MDAPLTVMGYGQFSSFDNLDLDKMKIVSTMYYSQELLFGEGCHMLNNLLENLKVYFCFMFHPTKTIIQITKYPL